MNTRAQSSVIGPVLLVGVFVTVGVVAGGAVVTNVANQSTGVEANIAGEIEEGELRLTHMGGDSIRASNLQLLFRGDTTADFRFIEGTLNGNPLSEPTDELFTAGDIWRIDLSSRPEFTDTKSWSGVSVRLVTGDGDVVATISTVEEIISPEAPETYIPGGTPTPTTTATPTPTTTATPTPTPTATPTPTPDDENGDKPPADSVYTISDDGDREKIFEIQDGAGIDPQWDFGDGTTSNNYYVVHQYDSAGQYTMTLDITIDGTQYRYTETVDTNPVTDGPNKPPIEDVLQVSNPDWTGERERIFEVGQGNKPQWNFGDGTASNNYYRNHRYSSDGEYTVTLDVTIDGTRYRYTTMVSINSSSGNGNGNGNNGNGNNGNGKGN